MAVNLFRCPIFRSVAICGTATILMLVENQWVPQLPAVSDAIDHAKINRHCITGILPDVAIDLDAAVRVQLFEPGTPIEQITAMLGANAYCRLADKTSPSGIRSTPYVFPIWAESHVLIVYIDEGNKAFAGAERWDTSPPAWQEHLRSSQVAESVLNQAVQPVEARGGNARYFYEEVLRRDLNPLASSLPQQPVSAVSENPPQVTCSP